MKVCVISAGFLIKDETIEVKEIMEGHLPIEEKLDLLHKKYNTLVRDYKRIERRVTECQKKQLEVGVVLMVGVASYLMFIRFLVTGI